MLRRWLPVLWVAAAGVGCGSSDEPVIAAAPTEETAVPMTSATAAPAPEPTTAASTTTVIGSTTAPSPTTLKTAPATTTTAAKTSTSGVRGTVTAGPTCPVERIDQPCPPGPVSATVEAVDGAGRVAGRGGTDGAGRYAIDLTPGPYTLRVTGTGLYPRCPDTDIVVGPGSPGTVDISCDTGIR